MRLPVAPLFAVIQIDVNPVLIYLGPIAVHWYGVMYVVGIVAGLALFGVLWVLRRRFRAPGTLFALWLVLYSAGQYL